MIWDSSDARSCRRLWVVQESALARVNTCYCGDYTLDLLDVLRAAFWIWKNNDRTDPKFLDVITPAANLFMLVDREHGRFAEFKNAPAHLGKIEASFPSLSYLLKFFAAANFNVTEPKDGLFGLLGLISPPENMPEQARKFIEPDYNKSLGDIHRDATRYCLFEDGDLSYLRRVSHLSDDLIEDGAPSWVVRATRDRDNIKGSPMDLCLGPSSPIQFSSCGDQQMCKVEVMIPFNDDPNILSLRGMIVDLVEETSDVFRPELFLSRNRAQLAEILQFIAEFTFAFALSKTEDVENIDFDSPTVLSTPVVRTLLADSSQDYTQISNEELQVMLEFLNLIITAGSTMSDGEAARIYDTMYLAVRSLYRACMNRRFFMTELGFMGLGPRGMKKEDMVVILHGGAEPFVVRVCEGIDRCQLLGQAYLSDDVMFGAAVEAYAKSGEPNVMFHLI